MNANPPIGAIVRGADAHGRGFEAEVVRHLGTATVELSDGFATPISLIHEVVRLPGESPAIEADGDPMRAATCTDNDPTELDLGSWEDEQGEAA